MTTLRFRFRRVIVGCVDVEADEEEMRSEAAYLRAKYAAARAFEASLDEHNATTTCDGVTIVPEYGECCYGTD